MDPLRIPPGKKALLSISPAQPDGEPAPVDGFPTFEVGPEGVVTLEEVEPGVVKIVAGNGEGVTTLTVRGDVRIGEQVLELVEVYELEVVEEASTFGVALGEFEPIIDT